MCLPECIQTTKGKHETVAGLLKSCVLSSVIFFWEKAEILLPSCGIVSCTKNISGTRRNIQSGPRLVGRPWRTLPICFPHRNFLKLFAGCGIVSLCKHCKMAFPYRESTDGYQSMLGKSKIDIRVYSCIL